jgi:hypothetical protein
MVERAAQAAGFDMKIHPHMLRCATQSWRRRGSRVFGATSHPKTRRQTPVLLAIVEVLELPTRVVAKSDFLPGVQVRRCM